MSRSAYVRLIQMSLCAALITVLTAKRRARPALAPRVGPSRPRPPAGEPDSRLEWRTIPDAAASRGRKSSVGPAEVQRELALSVAPKAVPAAQEMRRLFALPAVALAAPSAGASADERSALARRREVSSELLAGLKRSTRGPYSVHLIAAATVALIALAVMYVSINGGGSGARNFAVTGPPPAEAPSGGVSAAESSGVADRLLDARRKLDLGQLRDALNSYSAFFGKYPSTDGALTTFCSSWTDAGCDVVTHGRGLPVSDGSLPYWYSSEGTAYTLMAQMQAWPDVDDCPEVLPPQIGEAPVFCITGAIGRR